MAEKSTLNHLMIDIESFGNVYNSAVVSIGAVYFDPWSGNIGPKFYRSIDIADSIRFGRVDGDTLKWWFKQSDDARAAAIAGTQPLGEALSNLEEFYSKGRNAQPWGNGASFDITILEHAYLQCLRRKAPWDFWNIRDVRTIVELAKGICERPREFGKGTAHNALDDAVHQAAYVSDMWQALKRASKHASEPAPVPAPAPAPEPTSNIIDDLEI